MTWGWYYNDCNVSIIANLLEGARTTNNLRQGVMLNCFSQFVFTSFWRRWARPSRLSWAMRLSPDFRDGDWLGRCGNSGLSLEAYFYFLLIRVERPWLNTIFTHCHSLNTYCHNGWHIVEYNTGPNCILCISRFHRKWRKMELIRCSCWITVSKLSSTP